MNENSQSVKYANVTIPANCDEFLADMSNDLSYNLCCDWNFSPRVDMASNWPAL